MLAKALMVLRPISFRSAGICFLERGLENRIEPYTNHDVVFQFLKQTYRPKDVQYSNKLLSLIESLLEKIPVWRMECNREPEAAHTAWEAMTKGTIS